MQASMTLALWRALFVAGLLMAASFAFGAEPPAAAGESILPQPKHLRIHTPPSHWKKSAYTHAVPKVHPQVQTQASQVETASHD